MKMQCYFLLNIKHMQLTAVFFFWGGGSNSLASALEWEELEKRYGEQEIQGESKKVDPLRVSSIFSLGLSLFA